MNYEFPIIRHIDDILPAIEGRPEFIVAEKDGYTVINYNVVAEDTFPPVNVAGGSAKMRAERSLVNALRRECRGIIFDSETGRIIRRPYHKFFNVDEREETQAHRVNLGEKHVILEKLDGSMIVPFIARGELLWGTKMGETEVAKSVEEFVKNNPQYIELASMFIHSGWSPIFEWCSRKQRIVLDYKEDRLILTAVRNMLSGYYMSLETMMNEITFAELDIPVVRAFEPQEDMKNFQDYVRDQEELEGYVIRFADGHMLKLKCHWYIQIHKAKEAILWDRHVVNMIIRTELDDVKAHLLEEDRNRLIVFENKIVGHIDRLADELLDLCDYYREDLKVDRKEFALKYADKTGMFKPLIFKLWDTIPGYNDCRNLIVNTIENFLGSNTKYEVIKNEWFNGDHYNAV